MQRRPVHGIAKQTQGVNRQTSIPTSGEYGVLAWGNFLILVHRRHEALPAHMCFTMKIDQTGEFNV
jgi:hypothetical protein